MSTPAEPPEPSEPEPSEPEPGQDTPGTEPEAESEPPVPPVTPIPPLPPPPPPPLTKNAPLNPAVEPPSPDVQLADETALPGVHRGGFLRLPTAPVAMLTQSAPTEPGGAEDDSAQWQPSLSPAPARRRLANWALAFSIVGLLGSFFVGWGVPLGLVGIVVAIIALRRQLESREVAVWALVLGIVSVVYSAGWLLFAATRAGLFG